MLTESLNIYVIDKDGNKVTFPNVEGMQPAIVDVNLNRERMAGAPTNTSTLMYPVCLDSYWTKKEFIEIGSERYYVKQVPTSEKNIEDTRYKHEITFVSERDILENVFFFDCVTQDTSSQISDKPRSNTTEFSFYGDLNELVQRLNDSLSYSKIYDPKGENGFCIVIDDDVEIGEAKEVSMTDAYFATAMQEIYNVFEVPYYWVGKICHVGYQENEITEPFEYGSGNGLISVQKTNAEFRLINRITGQGSADNIPYYYPNTDPNGIPVTEYKNMKESDISGVVPTKIANLVGGIIGKRIYFGEIQKGNGTVLINEQKQYAQKEIWQINKDDQDVGYDVVERDYSPGFEKYEISFYANVGDKIDLTKAQFKYNVTIASDYNVTCNPTPNKDSVLYWGNGVDADIFVIEPDNTDWRITSNDLTYKCTKNGLHKLTIHCNPLYDYINCHVDFPENKDVVPVEATFAFALTGSIFLTTTEGNVVVCDNVIYPEKKIPFEVSDWGALRLLNIVPTFDAAKGIVVKELLQGYDYSSCSQFCILDIKKTNIMSKLMPSVYRETEGAERFYNAKNETYLDDNGEFYSFNNPYVPSEPLEGKQDFEDIKPTINGITNENGELFGEIAAVAFDDTDSDDLCIEDAKDANTNTAKPVHPYFYVKLHRFSGVNGFNLFKQGLAQGAMTFNFITGSCAGCSFKVQVSEGKQVDNHYEFKNEVQVDEQGNIVAGDSGDKIKASNPIDSQQDTMTNSVWIALEKDNSTFGVLMPNATNNYRPQAGDKFVITNILLPTQYITAAEKRLDAALVKYMSENNDEKFTFSIKFSRIYLQEHPEIAEKINENTKLHVKYNNVDYPLYVSSYSRKSDDNILDEISVELSEKLTIAQNKSKEQMDSIMGNVNEQINSAIQDNNNNTSQGVSANDINSLKTLLGNKLSRVSDDTAAGIITFLQGLVSEGTITAKEGLTAGTYIDGLYGSGASIDKIGNAVFESIYARSFISAPEYRYQRILVTEGEQWNTNGYGMIESVDTDNRIIVLHLEENDYASVVEGDYCRGIYNNMGTTDEYQNMINIEADDCGFPMKAGFFTSYFRVSDMIESSKGKCSFRYELRNSKTPHPCAQMKFAQYANDIDETRQASAYFSSVGHFYFQGVEKVSSWVVRPENVTIRFGWVNGFPAKLKDGSTQLLRNYGLYVPENIYFGNAIVQIDAKSVENIKTELEQYSIEISNAVDVITVDDAGNVIGGLYKLNPDNTKYDYRISPAVYVKKGNGYLVPAEDGDDSDNGTYKMYITPKNCTAELINGTICVTSIDNIKDGISGTSDDTEFDYDAMRKTESISVVISAICEGIGSISKEFHVAIKHDSKPYISFVMDNQNASVSWNTKAQKYIGLPYTVNINARRADESVAISGVTVHSGDGITTTSTINKDGSASVTFSSLPQTLENVTDVPITIQAIYAGISYEQTIVHTINRYEDVNVYELKPSVSQVVASVNTNGDKVASVNKVTCEVLCNSSDDKQYYLTSSDMKNANLTVKYSVDGGTTFADYTSDGVTVSPEWDNIIFRLYLNGGLIDSQDVPVMLNGVDGEGIEYVFILSKEEVVPNITFNPDSDEYQKPDYLPTSTSANTEPRGQWTDDSNGVGANYPFEYCAIRRKQYGKWLPFETPKLWGRYAKDGENPYVIDLTNNSSSVLCNDKGVAISSYEDTTLVIYEGTKDVTSTFSISFQAVGITCKKSSNGYTYSFDNITADVANVTFTAVKGNVTLKTVYTVARIKNGVMYSLVCSHDTVRLDNTGKPVSTDSTLYISVRKTTPEGSVTSTSVSEWQGWGVNVYYLNSSGTYEAFKTSYDISYNTAFGSRTYAVFQIRKSDGSTVLDSERINAVSDGKKGDTGDPAVEYSLKPNMTSIIIDDNNKIISGSSLSVTLYKTVGSSTTQSTEYSIFAYYIYNGGTKTEYGQVSGAITITSIADNLAAYYFEVHDSNNKILAVLTIPVVRHGKPSMSIVDRGLFDLNSGYGKDNGGYSYKYVNGTLVRDMVKYLSSGAYYYYMVKNRTDLGSGNVTASPNDSSKWEQASKYNLLVADVVYADNATFGGFHVDQDALWTGANSKDNATILLNGKENKVRVTGEVNATSGTFGNCTITNTCRIHQTDGNGWFLVGAQTPSEDKPNGEASWWLGYAGSKPGQFTMENEYQESGYRPARVGLSFTTPRITSTGSDGSTLIQAYSNIPHLLATFSHTFGMAVRICPSEGTGIEFLQNTSSVTPIAFKGTGHGCLNGVIQGYKLNVMTSGLIDISKGNTVYCNGVSSTLSLPKLKNCRDVLGTSGAFALDLTIIGASGASNFRVEGSDRSTLTDCELVSNNHAAWYATMSQGDVLKLKLISNGSTLIAYIVSLFN